MIEHYQLTEIIEHLRIQKKLSYQTFLENIVSERSYRRYVNEGKPFNFEILIQLVDKLQMKMRDFIIYALNFISVKHQEEIYLAHYLNHDMDEEAASYVKKVQPPFHTYVGSKILPSLIKRYDFKQKRIDIYQYLHFLRSQLSFSTLVHQHSIDRSTVKVLLLLLKDGTLDDQLLVLPILFNIINNNTSMISHQIDVDLSDVIHTTAYVLFSNNTLKETFKDELPYVFVNALENVKKYHIESSYPSFFRDALTYTYQKDSSFSTYLMYYLMSKFIENKDYQVRNDPHVMSKISVSDFQMMVHDMDVSTLYFMKEGDV